MFIDSPDLEALGVALERVDPVTVYQDAARETGVEQLEPLVSHLTAEAGGSAELLDSVGTYTAANGEVYVGVPDSSPHAAEMRRIEYGGVDSRPSAPIRHAVAMRQRELDDHFGTALNRHLDEELSQ